MRSCDDCPNTSGCAGINLHPVLVRVFDLYAAGTTDKFAILEALSEADEALIEKFDHRVSPVCWSKAALLALADVMARPTDAAAAIATGRDAFERFPWRLEDLVEQAADLYQAVAEKDGGALAETMSKRAFVKICTSIAYRR